MKFVSTDEIRTLFSRAMSAMYQKEVPKYGTLLELVDIANQQVLEKDTQFAAELADTNNLYRIREERHGAIRLGKPEELGTICELFAVMGMYPVGYYDLSVAHMPVHSTAFRPLENAALQANPFRIFTSLLRTDLIKDKAIVNLIEEILSERDIFTSRARELIIINKKNGGLTKVQAEEFVKEAVETFRWHDRATISYAQYQRLKAIHPLAADIVSFKGPHINHLTPRTLDIDAVQSMMPKYHIDPKAVIEGPPHRKVPILLRQTSFKAIEEQVYFPDQGKEVKGAHRARFGEIEQRGVALRPAGVALYDQLIVDTRSQVEPLVDGTNAQAYYQALENAFKRFPDDLEKLRQQKLVYLSYRPTQLGLEMAGKLDIKDLDTLIESGFVTYSPITYEDFLPVSAAGIFSSNLGDDPSEKITSSDDQSGFEAALGQKIHDKYQWYEKLETDSIIDTCNQLGVSFMS